ncbi:MAG TPA: hypothetical protein VIA45_09130 [Thermoanaerobaculia bacterium]|jgi:hypothetical protein
MRTGILAVIAFAAASAAGGSEIHGTLSEAGKPVAGAVLNLDCSGAASSAKTDKFGSYSLKSAGTGECRLSLDRGGAMLSLRVTLYEKPSRYDLEVASEAGKPILRRK